MQTTGSSDKKQGRPSELSLTAQRSLLQEIKLRGGSIKACNITKLCDDDTDTFGLPRSTTRRAIQNQVDYYKRNPERYHSQQLDLLGDIFERLEGPSNTPTPPRSTLATTKASASSPQIPIDLFNAMSVNDYYGKVKHDFACDINYSEGWKNHGVLIFKSPAIKVGANPVISTSVLTIIAEGVDARFFDIDDFDPFKLTQTGPSQFVVEKPAAGFDTLFPLGNGDEEDDNTENFVVSNIENEQNEYNIVRNKLVQRDSSTAPQDYSHYRSKTLFRCQEGEVLDFALIDPDKREGEVDYDFIGHIDSAQLSVKWRIAFKPSKDETRVIKQQKKSKNKAKEKFERYKVKRAGETGSFF
jgi:hypothetical protein